MLHIAVAIRMQYVTYASKLKASMRNDIISQYVEETIEILSKPYSSACPLNTLPITIPTR